MNDMTFEQGIARIAEGAAYPATPDLRSRVMREVSRERRSISPAPTTRRPLAYAAIAGAAAAVLAAGAALAVPSSRDAVANFFGIEGSKIEIIPTTTPLPPPEDIGATARLVSVEEASAAIGFRLALPADGEPRAVYQVRYAQQHVSVLRYDEFDLWQARLDSDTSFGKGAPSGVTVTDTFVDSVPARWISGGPHWVQFNDARGNYVEGSGRTVETNTLIWNDGETFFRLETPLSMQEAIDVARSLR